MAIDIVVRQGINPSDVKLAIIEENLRMISEVIKNCEEIQHDRNESQYSKECAKISAYNEIVELFNVEV